MTNSFAMASTSQVCLDDEQRNGKMRRGSVKRDRRRGVGPYRTWTMALALVCMLSASLLGMAAASPAITHNLESRATKVNYTDPNDNGGQMLTVSGACGSA